jgi:signal transduction histidine kinase
MKSIRKTLTRRLSIIISLLVIAVLLAADIGVDSWVEQEFNQAMKAKIGMLQSLVNEDVEGVEFEFSGEYLPEFEGTSSPEYFQLWYKDSTFEKSDTLGLYTINELPYSSIGLEEYSFQDITLPDGRTGRVIYTRYIPQIDSEDRAEFYRVMGNDTRPSMVIAYATSTELLNFTLWFIDGAFLFALIIVPLVVRFTVRNTVAYALAPLDALNAKIKGLRFTTRQKHEAFQNDVEELEPITQSLNHFIEDNYSLYLREKRLTSDIAHELKTPVSELINMTEVAIKFPGEIRLEKDFKPRVLQIGTRMKNIISGLMLIQKYSFKSLELTDEIDIHKLVTQLIQKKEAQNFLVEVSTNFQLSVKSNHVAVESIISNLIDNAIAHGKTDTEVLVSLGANSSRNVYLRVTNKVGKEVNEDDLKHMFEPLWQKDASRTSEDNFGLGLSIVSALCDAIDAEVSVTKTDEEHISFLVSFKSQSISP